MNPFVPYPVFEFPNIRLSILQDSVSDLAWTCEVNVFFLVDKLHYWLRFPFVCFCVVLLSSALGHLLSPLTKLVIPQKLVMFRVSLLTVSVQTPMNCVGKSEFFGIRVTFSLWDSGVLLQLM